MINYTLQFRYIWNNIDFFVEGVQYTVILWFTSMIISIIMGSLVAIARNSKVKLIFGLAKAYVEVIRNTPLIIQLWLIYFGLGEFGIQIPVFTSGILALGINTTAYTAEIIRAGFEAVDKELTEAAYSLGMNSWQTYKVVIIPLGFRAVLPALCNMSIQALLASSLVSILGVNELTNQAMRVSIKTFRPFESFILVGSLYIFLSFCITNIFTLVNRKIKKGTLH